MQGLFCGMVCCQRAVSVGVENHIFIQITPAEKLRMDMRVYHSGGNGTVAEVYGLKLFRLGYVMTYFNDFFTFN